MSKECGHQTSSRTKPNNRSLHNQFCVRCHSNRIYYSKLKLTGCSRKCFKMNKYINVPYLLQKTINTKIKAVELQGNCLTGNLLE